MKNENENVQMTNMVTMLYLNSEIYNIKIRLKYSI